MRLIQASANAIPLPDESVQCVVTSPPYWGLRQYAGEQQGVWGGDLDHAHEWGPEAGRKRSSPDSGSGIAGTPRPGNDYDASLGCFCACGAWYGALGLEPTPELYVEHMVEVFRDVRRVLRKDGTLWLNLGDSYNAYNGGAGPSSALSKRQSSERPQLPSGYGLKYPGLKPKDLVGIPWRVAFALQADGWYLRSDIIWAKPNPMPESVTDRPTKAHEYLFLLSKSERYFYDADAIREEASWERWSSKQTTPKYEGRDRDAASRLGREWTQEELDRYSERGRNKRTVWTIPTRPYAGAHFATYPEDLVEPCILAGSSPKACGVCSAPWVRVGTAHGQSVFADALVKAREAAGLSRAELAERISKGQNNIWDWEVGGHIPSAADWPTLCAALGIEASRDDFIERGEYVTTGKQAGPKQQASEGDSRINRPYTERKRRIVTERPFRPSCEHDDDSGCCTVLDPFNGSGTTGVVAVRHNRAYVGVDISDEYMALARERINNVQRVLFLEAGA